MASIVAFAVVRRNGTLLHSENVDKVDHTVPGLYDIYFSVPTTVQVATLADPAVHANAIDGELTIAAYGGVVGPNVVRVRMFIGAMGCDCTFQVICAA